MANPEALVPAIRALLDGAGIQSKRVVTALGGEAAVIREVAVPAMPEAELAQAVAFEAERYLPAGSDEVRCEYRVVGRAPENGRLELLLVAAGKGTIDRQLAPLRMAGLASEVMEVTPFSMVRAVAPRAGQNGDAVMYADLGAESSDVLIVEAGRVRLARTLAFGGTALTNAIAEALGLDAHAAQTLKEQRARLVLDGEPPGDATIGDLYRAILPVVSRLSTELRRSLDFYLARLRGRAPSRVILTGGTAKLRNLAPFLSAALGLPVEIGSPFAAHDAGAGVPPDYLADVAPMLAVAVGLALRGAHA